MKAGSSLSMVSMMVLRLSKLAHIDPHVKNDARAMRTLYGRFSTQKDLPNVRKINRLTMPADLWNKHSRKDSGFMSIPGGWSCRTGPSK